jgi:hypothetical protein
MIFARQFACLVVVLVATVAGLLFCPPNALAAKPQPSPFVGTYRWYSLDTCSITISSSGRISGFIYNSLELSGSISNTGAIKLKFVGTYVTWDGRKGRWTATAVGQGALDAEGNLVGVLQYDEDVIAELYWPRCN